MQENHNEQMEVETQATEVEKVEEGGKETEISLGKFKDVNALLNAYNSLQSEFTKRCQRIKELESKVVQTDKTTQSGSEMEEKLESNSIKGNTEEDKEQILKEYLKGILNSKQQAIIMADGVGLKTPSNKPKSIAEAGMLAKEILKK